MPPAILHRLGQSIGVALLLALAFARAAGATPVKITYSSIDWPGASSTVANGVNRTATVGHSVEVVGTYGDIAGTHGFLMSGGQMTKLDVPLPGTIATTADGINSRHQIVGSYWQPTNGLGRRCSYEYSQGTYLQIAADCYAGAPQYNTVMGINDAGTLVGFSCCPLGVNHLVGYSSPVGLRYDVPGSLSTQLFGINNRASMQMVGTYTDAEHHTHGVIFTGPALQQPGTTLDVPFFDATSTVLRGINDAGQIVGYFGLHGFLDDRGTFTRIDYPGASSTRVLAVNNPDATGRFDLVGAYVSGGIQHGFIAAVAPSLGGHT
jgi:uncharacterized membrane protein